MATNFPTSLDNLTNPTGSSSLTSPDHAGQHADANDAIEALQAKVGVNNSAVTTSLDYKVAINTPSGAILQYAGSSAPTGWLLCDGNVVSTTTYASLFAVIGYTYGGSGSLFQLPDLRGRVPAGKAPSGTFATLGSSGGAETVTLTTAQMPSHTHTQDSHNHIQNSHTHTQNAHAHGGSVGTGEFLYRDGSYSTGYNSWVGGVYLAITWNGATAGGTATNQSTTAVNNATTATNQNTGGGGSHTNLQPYIVLNYIIKV